MKLKIIAAATLLVGALAFPGVAPAADPPPVVQAIFKSWEKQFNINPSYRSLDVDASGNVTIQGLNATMTPEGGAPGSVATLTVGTIKLENISDQGNGLYDVGSATYSDIKIDLSASPGTASINIPEAGAEDWYVKALGDNPTALELMRASMSVAKKMHTGKISINSMGQTASVDGYESSWDGDPATGAGIFKGKISNVSIPEQTIVAIDPNGELKKLGYSSIAFDLGGEGKLDISGEKFGIDGTVYYVGKNMGTLRFGVALAGVPAAVYTELAKAREQQPNFTPLMPQLMMITLGKAMLRFEDASLTKRVLSLATATQGTDEQTLIASAGAMVQLSLAQLKNQAFTQKVVAAVTTFLKDPHSITISIQPAQPMAVEQLMNLDSANPGAAIDMLGVNVTAND